MRYVQQINTATGVGHARGGDRGEQGELIDRLITLLDNDALGEHMWYNVGRYARTQKTRQPVSPSAAAPDAEVCVPASAVVVAGHMSATLRSGVMR